LTLEDKTKLKQQNFHSFAVMDNISENSTKCKRKTHVKTNLKTRNKIISSLHDELLQPSERKMKVVSQQANYFVCQLYVNTGNT